MSERRQSPCHLGFPGVRCAGSRIVEVVIIYELILTLL
jgi:hypothetical protein